MTQPIYRIYVERKPGFDIEAQSVQKEAQSFLGLTKLEKVRFFIRYDISGISESIFKKMTTNFFHEPQRDTVYFDQISDLNDAHGFGIEYLPGQFDQRIDSTLEALKLLLAQESGLAENRIGGNVAGSASSSNGGVETLDSGATPHVRTARFYALYGTLSQAEIQKLENYLINPVDSKKVDFSPFTNLALNTGTAQDVPIVEGFTSFSKEQAIKWAKEANLAMEADDVIFMQDYFKSINRNPSETEIRVLDTYWSDHCRHSTFNTILESISIEDGPYAQTFQRALDAYSGLRTELYTSNTDKPVTLMDIAVIGAKTLKKRGLLDDLEESAEINACSIFIDVNITDSTGKTIKTEPWLLMFKNETHNHPTEIEPFGGANTCIGGAIRDPLSGRSWVYQAMRITGAGNPLTAYEDTLPEKLPQRKLVTDAATGYSSYANQIGITGGQVIEFYHEGFVAKRMELGAVVAAAPVSHVVREEPEAGDVVILVGANTGRDGIGGATSSSRVQTTDSSATASAEVQKGSPSEERKILRLFRDPKLTRIIKRCNDFGAGGVAVAVGELADGLNINLDLVPTKYDGLNGTELAISESQERMACIVRKSDAPAFIAAAEAENLQAIAVASVTEKPHLVMNWQGKTIVDLDRSFLDTSGAKRYTKARITQPAQKWDWRISNLKKLNETKPQANLKEKWEAVLQDLNCASQKGLTERFDSSIGAATVLSPLGGAYQATPECGMVARIPVEPGLSTNTVSIMSFGYDPFAAAWSPFHAAQYAVLESATKILALGGNPLKARLSFQEYFPRTSNEKAWGLPLAAVLGALEAQIALGIASIGGKDSMSGSYQDIHVPPSLVSFAVTTTEESNIRAGSFTQDGSSIVLVQTPWKQDGSPDWDVFKSNVEYIQNLATDQAIISALPLGIGGIALALSKMAFGNRMGATLNVQALDSLSLNESHMLQANTGGLTSLEQLLFAPLYGSLLLEVKTNSQEFKNTSHATKIGTTINTPFISIGEHTIALDSAQILWEKPLTSVFPLSSGTIPHSTIPTWASELKEKPTLTTKAPSAYSGKPRVLIPVFPGTNGEYDVARAFALAGAEPQIFVVKNRSVKDIQNSYNEFDTALKNVEILALAGGASNGDEPDGAGKYIAQFFREPRLADSLMQHLEIKKGLILGICNGFQALIKLGLLPYGKILEPQEIETSITYSNINRLVSRFVSTRMAHSNSAWAQDASLTPGTIHRLPVAHGEGRIIVPEQLAKELFAHGQVFSQYVEQNNSPTMVEPYNPNGSDYAIEGLTSPCGLVLGKMAHSDRTIDTAENLFKNIPQVRNQDIFAAAVTYWK